ncbi:MAG: COX15/CtaA family protein, partial [Thermomicrobiales bacterium]
MTRLYRLALANVVATLTLIALGSLARLHPAGSGCGNDWPRCNGSWLPALAWEPLVEYTHRGVALTVVVLTVATALLAFRTPGTSRNIRYFATGGLGVIVAQSIIGGITARWGAPPAIAILHLLAAMLFLAFAVATLAATAAQRGAPGWLAELGHAPARSLDRPFAFVAALCAAIALILVLFGASTSASGAFACATWPLCTQGSGNADSQLVIHLGYRATALLGTLAAAGSAVFAWRRGASRSARRLSLAAMLLVAVQSGLNALAAASGDPTWMSAPHLIVATLFWLTMLAVALGAWGPRAQRDALQSRTDSARAPSRAIPDPNRSAAVPTTHNAVALSAANPTLGFDLSLAPLLRLRRLTTDYVALTKPGIMSLLLATTLCAMLMAARGLPPFWLVAVTQLGGV